DSVPDGELAERLYVLAEIGWVEVLHGAFRDARRHYARGVALARRTGQYQILVTLLYGVASGDTWLGRLAAAAEHAAAASAAARTCPTCPRRPVPPGTTSWRRPSWPAATSTPRPAGRSGRPRNSCWPGSSTSDR